MLLLLHPDADLVLNAVLSDPAHLGSRMSDSDVKMTLLRIAMALAVAALLSALALVVGDVRGSIWWFVLLLAFLLGAMHGSSS